jgi:hypothetical protein
MQVIVAKIPLKQNLSIVIEGKFVEIGLYTNTSILIIVEGNYGAPGYSPML